MRLPSLEVTLAFVSACGGDPVVWREKWHAVAETARAPLTRPDQPAQLPPDTPSLAGRAQEIALLTEKCGPATERETSLVVVHGLVGSGKTALATHVAHRVRQSLPDGQLYAHLAGSTRRPRDPHEVLGGFIRSLGVTPEHIPGEAEQRAALYRSLLAERRMLIMLDDAGDETQVRPLLAPTIRSLVLVTARSRLAGLPATYRLALDVLDPRGSLEMLGALVGEQRIEAEHRTAERIADWCDHLPLALWVVGSRLAARPDWSIKQLSRFSRTAARRLHWLRAGDVDVSSRVDAAYRWLSPAARQLFHLLARARARVINRLPDFGLSLVDTEELVESIADSGLLQPHAHGLFLPRLFRIFAIEAARLEAY
jgi:hypothetical protein